MLKGPLSTFFGRGSTGGIINQVSKAPRLDANYSGILSGGMGQFWRGTMDVNQPLTQVLPNAALRLNLMAHRDNVVERDVIESDAWICAVDRLRLRHSDAGDDQLPDAA